MVGFRFARTRLLCPQPRLLQPTRLLWQPARLPQRQILPSRRPLCTSPSTSTAERRDGTATTWAELVASTEFRAEAASVRDKAQYLRQLRNSDPEKLALIESNLIEFSALLDDLATSPTTGDTGEEKIVIPWLTVSFTAMVLGAYVAYFYLIEQPYEQRRLVAEPEPPKALPSGVLRAMPDGRLLMADGSIRAAAAEQSTAGFVASPTFTGTKPGLCFKLGPAGVGYYVDEPLASRAHVG